MKFPFIFSGKYSIECHNQTYKNITDKTTDIISTL